MRITNSRARHYDELGLLVPDGDRRAQRDTGSYGEAQLVRGMQIEQLKATGLSLDNIKRVLDIHGAADGALRERRRQIEQLLADHAAQLAAIDALLAGRSELATPELVVLPAQHVVVAHTMASHDELSRTIRRTIQQLGRSVRQQDGVRCRSFSARFPLEVDDPAIPVQIAGHLDKRATASAIQPAETQLKVELVGNVGLLPIAYDVVLTAVRERGLQPVGTAVEHYLDLDEVGRTEVAIPIQGWTLTERPRKRMLRPQSLERGPSMLMFSRVLTLSGSPRRAMPWAVGITEYVNAHSSMSGLVLARQLRLSAWDGGMEFVSSSRRLPSPRARLDLLADPGYFDMIESAADMVAGPGQDTLRELVLRHAGRTAGPRSCRDRDDCDGNR